MNKYSSEQLSDPINSLPLLRKQKKLRRELKEHANGPPLRVAILGGSTTSEVRNFIELFLLNDGINAEFYESRYNQYYEDAVFDNPSLDAFSPQYIYIHTNHENILQWPSCSDSPKIVDEKLENMVQHLSDVWSSLEEKYHAPIFQNNFELPFSRPLGNMDATAHNGKTQFVIQLNQALAQHANTADNFYIHDLQYLSAWFGLSRWFDRAQWHTYKFAMCNEAFPHIGKSIATLIKAANGKSKKCLVCDLDNTLWGGVIGDDGPQDIKIGSRCPEGEAYAELHQYIKGLKDRGIILAICSKNDENNALSGLALKESILKEDDFSIIKANWLPKDQNILAIASELNISTDALVFLDDSPRERSLVASNIPSVAVPDIGDDVCGYVRTLDSAGYFEALSLNKDDLSRSAMYHENTLRKNSEKQFASYREYLTSLHMESEIGHFTDDVIPRITQLINKTNQFNLTTERLLQGQITRHSHCNNSITLYSRLSDKFGDNGIVSAIIGEVEGKKLSIQIWVMSCRVFMRELEVLMFEHMIRKARARGCAQLIGTYIPTEKNQMVAEHYKKLGFHQVESLERGGTQWAYDISESTSINSTQIHVQTVVDVKGTQQHRQNQA